MTVIAFMGEKKSGKDFFTDHLAQFGFSRLSFSDEVKRLAKQIYPWLPQDVSPEEKDKPFFHKNNPNNLTYRQIILTVGKVRDVDPGYFVKKFEVNQFNKINHFDHNFILTDFRTYDEHLWLKSKDIPIIKIVREDRTGIQEDAFEDYVRAYQQYDAQVLNRLNGTDEFIEFFKVFCATKKIQVDGLN